MSIQLQPGHRLEWAILVPTPAARLEALVRALDDRCHEGADEDEVRTWHVIAGSGEHAALIETEPGSSGTESELAVELAREVGATVYAVGFSGYDDPDDGLPFIEAYAAGTRRIIWMAETFDDEIPEVELSSGPEGVPCDDPFAFAEALGCRLRQLYSPDI